MEVERMDIISIKNSMNATLKALKAIEELERVTLYQGAVRYSPELEHAKEEILNEFKTQLSEFGLIN